MTQEDKELLLKDLCGRLPYGVKVQIQNSAGYDVTFQLSGYSMGYFRVNGDAFEEDEIKPYLRPMSSMTEEETLEFVKTVLHVDCGSFWSTDSYDWLNRHHFDYRGLIVRGLALKAVPGIY